MNKQTTTTPAQKPEIFKVKKNYCWLTGYPVDKASNKQKPVVSTIKLNLR